MKKYLVILVGWIVLFAVLLLVQVQAASESPTLPHKSGEEWKLNLTFSPAYDFMAETVEQFCIDQKYVGRILTEEYHRQLYQYKRKTMRNRLEALERTINWCRYWRDCQPRLHLTPEVVASMVKGEYFFRSIRRKHIG